MFRFFLDCPLFQAKFAIICVSDFYFDLPDELIVCYPKLERTTHRLLLIDGENREIFRRTFAALWQIEHIPVSSCINPPDDKESSISKNKVVQFPPYLLFKHIKHVVCIDYKQ